MTLPLPGQEPARFQGEQPEALAPRAVVSANQRVAENIAEQLRQSGRLQQYRIDVSFEAGAAKLTGTVADQPQREAALRIVQGVPGVECVVDQLSLAEGAISTVQAQTPVPQTTPQLAPAPRKLDSGPDTVMDPVPTGPVRNPSLYDVNRPQMPPYAWPTYAPFNNYSRVAYPEAYPYNAWPFIGPVYPFPKVPLGWRSVKLEWQDGHWWFSKVATKHDWWRIRYW
jgi:hypothetical protein